jgi:hypothetical protein
MIGENISHYRIMEKLGAFCGFDDAGNGPNRSVPE